MAKEFSPRDEKLNKKLQLVANYQILLFIKTVN